MRYTMIYMLAVGALAPAFIAATTQPAVASDRTHEVASALNEDLELGLSKSEVEKVANHAKNSSKTSFASTSLSLQNLADYGVKLIPVVRGVVRSLTTVNGPVEWAKTPDGKTAIVALKLSDRKGTRITTNAKDWPFDAKTHPEDPRDGGTWVRFKMKGVAPKDIPNATLMIKEDKRGPDHDRAKGVREIIADGRRYWVHDGTDSSRGFYFVRR